MALTDITNTNTTVGSVTRIIELGVEAIGFGILCGVKKDTKEIRRKEDDILDAARRIETTTTSIKKDTNGVVNWIAKVDKGIEAAQARVQHQVQQTASVAQPQQAPPTQQAAFTQADIDAAVKAALAKQAQPATEPAQVTINNNVTDAGKKEELPPATFTQADIDAAVAKANAASAENMKTQINAAAEAAAKTAVEQYIASQQKDDKSNGKK